jgi:hypothetical protein
VFIWTRLEYYVEKKSFCFLQMLKEQFSNDYEKQITLGLATEISSLTKQVVVKIV